MKKHQGKVIVVTGAGRGLGRAYAERLSSEGARVAVAEIDAVAGAHAAEELRKSGMDSMFIETDVSSKEATEAMAARVLEKWGQIDGLVANAGLANSVGGRTYDEITVAQWDRIMEVNVRGTWLSCRAVAPYMQERKNGSIVTVSSDTAAWGSPKLLHYVTSKGAVEAFTRAMARELGPDGVRINCVAPGLLNNEATAGVPEAKREWNIRNRAIQREGTTDDIVGLVSFLLSDEASFITGQLIVANGGLVFH
ncbi:MAG: short-chain dehydrogenase [Acidobacteria bacterium]|nr:MAG: short-chain dehydrogenase [Acidobacteriota bacterium]